MPPVTVQQPQAAKATETPKPASVSTPAQPEQKTPVTTDDLMRRAATPAQAAPQAPSAEAPKVSVNLDDVKDPVSRSILEKKLQEANAGIARTFGEIGAEKQSYLKKIEDLNRQVEDIKRNQSTWTPERLRQELSRQDFIQAAQTLQATSAPPGWDGTAEEWSGLSPSEKAQFQNIVANQSQLEGRMNQMLQSQIDATLKTKYPDYNPQAVDSFIRDAAEGRIPHDQIRELVHKALNAERYVKQAYELAMQDKTLVFQDKINGSTQTGFSTTVTEQKPERQANEPERAFFARLGRWNLARIKEQTAR